MTTTTTTPAADDTRVRPLDFIGKLVATATVALAEHLDQLDQAPDGAQGLAEDLTAALVRLAEARRILRDAADREQGK